MLEGKIEVKIEIEGEKRFLESFKKAIEPDNVNFPEGVSLKVNLEDEKLIISGESSKKAIMSLLNSLDEILELAKAVQRGAV